MKRRCLQHCFAISGWRDIHQPIVGAHTLLRIAENDSYDWDLDETPVAVRKSLAESAEALHQIERGYDVPHFITGFESMVNDLKEQGVILDNERKFEPKLAREDNVTADFGL